MAEYLGIPDSIIGKAPSAGFWTGQTDEGEFGFSYSDADQIIFLYYDKKKKKEEIVKRGFEMSLVEKVIKMAEQNTFKRKTPYKLA